MNLPDILDKLKLNKYEKSAYTALYKLDEATSKEICKNCDVPYGRIYNILTSLEQKGLVSITNSSPKLFKISEPKIALSAYLEKKRDELQKIKEEIKSLKLPPQMPLLKEIAETIIVKGKESMRQIKDIMTQNAKNEMLTTHFGMKDARVKAMILKEKMLARKVKERLILSEIKKTALPKIRKAISLGSKIRIFPHKGLKLIIKDREEAMICIIDHTTKDYLSVYTNNKPFAESLAVLFDSMWEKGKDFMIQN